MRRALESHPDNYISQDAFFALCPDDAFDTREKMLDLSDYLHDLGIVLHFQDDPLLKRWVILKPEWATNAVYEILKNKKVVANFGRFTKQDVAEIWHEAEYEDMHDELIQLMKNFQLCYELQSGAFIAPQLLSEDAVDYEWSSQGNLQFRYKYDGFMPKGILSRFIVKMHNYVKQENHMWKSGVVLSKDGAEAEILEDRGKREISIRL